MSRAAVERARRELTSETTPSLADLVLAALSSEGQRSEGALTDVDGIAGWIDYINHDGCTAADVCRILEPDVSGSGHLPQAQAITDAEPNVWGSGNEPQVRQDLVEVSFDDIDDGPCEPPGCPGSRVPQVVGTPRAWQSRAGIMLDTAAVPPGLKLPVLADSARIAPQPTALA